MFVGLHTMQRNSCGSKYSLSVRSSLGYEIQEFLA